MPGFHCTCRRYGNCAHGGQAQPTVPNPRVTVMGQPTVAVAAPYVVAGCALPPPSGGNGPCVSAPQIRRRVRCA